MSKELEGYFPALENTDYEITSDKTTDYNCIAWAAGDTSKWWWPYPFCFWPRNLPMSRNINNFVNLFASFGYIECKDGKLESGYEKVAIYVDNSNHVTHASRQLENGHWTSKLGEREDIRHDKVESICGSYYGCVARYMKRENRK